MHEEIIFDRMGRFDISLQIGADYDWELKIFLNKSISKKFLNLAISCFDVSGISMQNSRQRKTNREAVKEKILYSVNSVVDVCVVKVPDFMDHHHGSEELDK